MNSYTKKKIAVWQPFFLGGGAEAVALWILEALKDNYEVTLHTIYPVDFSWLNKMYGTSLSETSIKVHAELPRKLARSLDFLMSNNEILRMALVYLTIKNLKNTSRKYDVLFSAFNAVDMGQQGVQYLHWTHVVESPYEKAKFWQKVLMDWVQLSPERIRQNVSVSNSKYTSEAVSKKYGIQSKIVFPPVVAEMKSLPWEQKEDLFICSGRLVFAKQPHRVINILKSVREKGFNVKLHITGAGGGGERKYQKKIYSLAEKNSEWIYIHENLPYCDYLDLVSRCRYGLHYKPEPFGISIAEMVKSGVIPFVRKRGGQIEIVGEENGELLFDDHEEAVDKIVNVLSNPALQQKISKSLEQRKYLFGEKHFTESIQSLVEEYLASSSHQNSIKENL
ncbi:MAG: glycosyltransferase family 4 protein [Leptolyngbyaceae cyanobacterium]